MAIAIGINSDSIKQIETGKIPPSDEFLKRLEGRLGVSGRWLKSGEGPILSKHIRAEVHNKNPIERSGKAHSAVSETGMTSANELPKIVMSPPKIAEEDSIKNENDRTFGEESNMIPGLQFRQLPVVTFKVATGIEPFSPAHLDAEQPYIMISENFHESQSDLVAVRVSGSNMTPTIREGAIACIDRSDKTIAGNNIYAVHNGHGKGAVTRLKVIQGCLVILPDNRECEVEIIELSSDQDPEDFVIGKVIWVWQNFS